MNTSSINNAQNSYALYSTPAPATTQSSNTTGTPNNTSSSLDTVTISPEALALQQASDQNVIEPPTNTPSAGGGHSIRPPV